MGLREIAAADLRIILEDTDGFAWPITISDPNQVSADLLGFSNDISQAIDPQTGEAVAGRFVSVALPIAALVAAGLGMPRGIADGSGKPWVVTFNDILGNSTVWKIIAANPDRAIGVVTCTLESYRLP